MSKIPSPESVFSADGAPQEIIRAAMPHIASRLNSVFFIFIVIQTVEPGIQFVLVLDGLPYAQSDEILRYCLASGLRTE